MTLNEYQKLTIDTADSNCDSIEYLALALCGEAGEVANKIKKILRDQDGAVFAPDCIALAHELGDVMWYLSVLAQKLGFTLSNIAEFNIEKINGRLERGTLHGSGDNR